MFAETDQEREKRKRELEELRAEVKTLKYTIDNHKQEEELAKLKYEGELRNEKRRAEEDFKKMQVGIFLSGLEGLSMELLLGD